MNAFIDFNLHAFLMMKIISPVWDYQEDLIGWLWFNATSDEV